MYCIPLLCFLVPTDMTPTDMTPTFTGSGHSSGTLPGIARVLSMNLIKR